MGFSTSVYVGVHIEVDKGERIVEVTSYKDSINGERTSHKFNPENGEPNEVIIKLVKENSDPNPYDVGLDEYEDDFWSPEFDGSKKGISTWLSNTGDFGTSIDVDSEPKNINLEGLDTDTEILKFESKYEEFLTVAKVKYPSLRVVYGLVTYAS